MNIYVGNLSYSMTKEELCQLFEEVGPVLNANIIIDRETGNSKGFGFVEMENSDDVEPAIEKFDGLAIKGRNLRVNKARPREERPNRW